MNFPKIMSTRGSTTGPAMTGRDTQIIMKRDMAEGFDRADFTGCIDASDWLPRGSVTTFTWRAGIEHVGVVHTIVKRPGVTA